MRATAILGALAALALAAGCGGGDDDEAADILLTTLTNDSPDIRSANSALSLSGSLEGDQGGDFSFSLAGPIEFGSEGETGALNWDVEAAANLPLLETFVGTGNIDFTGALTLVDGKLFVTYQDTAYEADRETSQQFSPTLEGSLGPTATSGIPEEDAQEFIDALSDLENEGTEDVGGEETTHLSATLDPEALEGLSGGDSPVSIEGLDSVDFDIWIADDDVARKVDIAADVAIPEEAQAFLPIEAVDFTLSSQISDLNAADEVTAPKDAQPLSKLFEELGVDPSTFQLPGLGGTSPDLGAGAGAEIPDIGTPGGAASDPATQACIAEAATSDEIVDCLNQ